MSVQFQFYFTHTGTRTLNKQLLQFFLLFLQLYRIAQNLGDFW